MKRTKLSAAFVIICFTFYVFASIYSLILCNSELLYFAFSDQASKTVVEKHLDQLIDKTKSKLTPKAIELEKEKFSKQLLGAVNGVEENQSPDVTPIMKIELDKLVREKIYKTLGLPSNANLIVVSVVGFMVDFILLFLILTLFIKKKKKGFVVSKRKEKYLSVVYLAPSSLSFIMLVTVITSNANLFAYAALSVLIVLLINALILTFRYYFSSILVHILLDKFCLFLDRSKIYLDRWAYNRVMNNLSGVANGLNFLDNLSRQGELVIINQTRVETIKVLADNNSNSNVPSNFEIKITKSLSYEKFLNNLFGDFKDRVITILKNRINGDFRYQLSSENFSAADIFFTNTAAKILEDLSLKISHRQKKKNNSHLFSLELEIDKLLFGSMKSFRQSLVASNNEVAGHFLKSLRELLIKELSAERQRIMKVNNLENLPDNFRFCITKENTVLMVIEQAPAVRTINYCGNRFRLSFPYLIFTVVFSEGRAEHLHVNYTQKEISSLDDQLFKVNLTNVFDDCAVCMSFDDSQYSSLEQKAKAAITNFWRSTFNDEALDCQKEYEDIPELADYDAWQKASVDPSFIMEISLIEDETLSARLSSILEEKEEDTDLSAGNLSVSCEKKIDSWLQVNNSLLSEAFLRSWQKIDITQFSEESLLKVEQAKRNDIKDILNLAVRSCNETITSTDTPYSLLTQMKKSWLDDLANCRIEFINDCDLYDYEFSELISSTKKRK